MAKRKTNDRVQINRIRVVLVEKQLTAVDLAEMVGRSANTINRICRNENQPTLGLLREIALALDVNIKDLLYDTK